MKKVCTAMSLVVFLSWMGIAVGEHMYKGELIPDTLFDDKEPSGLNLKGVMDNLKKEREDGKSNSFSTTVLNYASTNRLLKQQGDLLGAKAEELDKAKDKKTKKSLQSDIDNIKKTITTIQETRVKQRDVLAEAGLSAEQISAIPDNNAFTAAASQ